MDSGIYFKSDMVRIPDNCLSCKMYCCKLPDKKTHKGVKKKYYYERHENCPLLEVK